MAGGATCSRAGEEENRLRAVPRVGELIELTSINQEATHAETKHYQVVHVMHKMRDLSEAPGAPKTGWHFVEVFVKPSRSKFFKLGKTPNGPAARN